MRPALHLHSHECFPKQGGISRYCREMALAADRKGQQVTIHGPRTACRPKADGNQQRPGYQVVCGFHSTSHRPLNLWRSRSHLALDLKQAPNALHLLAEPGPILAYGLLPESIVREASVRLVLHGSEIERWAAWPWGSGRIARRAMERAEAVIVPSHPVRDRTVDQFPVVKDKVRVIAHALPESFRAAAAHIQDIQHPPRTDESLRLISVGRIHPRKGFDQVLQALSLLTTQEQRCIRYTIAGAQSKKSYRRQLERMAQRLHSQIEWRLDPDDRELIALYNDHQAFVLTSIPHKHSIEGFGLVYLEAAAFGLPALAYRTGGVCDAIHHDETGRLLPVNQPGQLAEAIRDFLQHPQARQKMGEHARRRALKRSWEDVVRETCR